MNIYLTTDTHFGHDKMVEYCDRPKDFNERILQEYRNTLKSGDILIHLGDICIGHDSEWHLDLNGYIPANVKRILVKGNHDRKSNTWYLTHGWDLVCDTFSLNGILFSHEPLEKFYGHSLNIHGHFHNKNHRLIDGKYQWYGKFNKKFSIEEHNYVPVKLDTFLKWTSNTS